MAVKAILALCTARELYTRDDFYAIVRQRGGQSGARKSVVICDGDDIICSGAIGPHQGREDESELFNIFLLPEYQGKGVGKLIIETLEQDEFFLRAKRVYIHSAMNALKFYQKMGYDHVNGEFAIDDEDSYTLEKFR